MKQVLGTIIRQAEINHTQVLNRTLLILNFKTKICYVQSTDLPTKSSRLNQISQSVRVSRYLTGVDVSTMGE